MRPAYCRPHCVPRWSISSFDRSDDMYTMSFGQRLQCQGQCIQSGVGGREKGGEGIEVCERDMIERGRVKGEGEEERGGDEERGGEWRERD